MFKRFMQVYRSPDDAGGSAASTGIEVDVGSASGIPDGFSQNEWNQLTLGEQAGFLISAETVEEEEGEIKEDDLDAVIGEEGGDEGEDEGEDVPADQAAGQAAVVSPVVPTGSYEDFLSTQVVVPTSTIPLIKGIPEQFKPLYADVESKFSEGDLDSRGYREAIREIDQDVTDFKLTARDTAREQAVWNKEQEAFYATVGEEYRQVEADNKTLTAKSDMLFGALSSQYARLLKDPVNTGKSQKAVLVMADKAVREAFSMPLPGKAAAVPAALKPPVPAAKLAKGVVNLATVPPAGEHDADPFAHIDRMRGVAKEEALAAMTPQQEAAYMRGARR